MATRKTLSKEELERKIMNAATNKRQVGTRTSVRGGQAIRSRTFSKASRELLERIAQQIIAEARSEARKLFQGTDPLFQTNDPRVREFERYMDAFDYVVFSDTNRPTVRVFNDASITLNTKDGIKKYRYGDVIEYGTDGKRIVPSNGKKLKIAVNEREARKIINRQSKGKKGKKNKSFARLSQSTYIKYSEFNGDNGYFMYTDSVPARPAYGIIARAVDKVLGKRAGNEVRRGDR